MSESEIFPSSICRLCTRKGLYNMFEHRLEISKDNLILISEAYEMFSSAKVDNKTAAPMLCAYCTEELGQAYNFYVKVKLYESESLIEADFIDIVEDEVEELNGDDGQGYIEMVVNENSEDNVEKDLVIYEHDDEVVSDSEAKTIMEVVEHVPIPHPGVKKFNKIPNIQLTSKVSSLLSRITKTSRSIRKRKSSNADDDESSASSSKIQKIEDTFIMAPRFVLYETRYPRKSPDDLNDEHRISEISEGSLFSTLEPVETKPNLSKRKMPALPTHKVTMDIAAVRLETNSTQLDIYSKLDKKEDASVLYQCSYCPKAFATQYHLGLHTQKVHVCQHCLTGFNKIQDLYAHVKAEHNTFICSFCNKQMSTNSNLRAHVRKIHGVALPAGVSLISLQNNKS